MCTFLSVSLVPEFTEPPTEELQDAEPIADDILDLETKISETSEETVQSKDVVVLCLVDDTKDIVMEESLPEEEILDLNMEKDIIGKDKSTIAFTTDG